MSLHMNVFKDMQIHYDVQTIGLLMLNFLLSMIKVTNGIIKVTSIISLCVHQCHLESKKYIELESLSYCT